MTSAQRRIIIFIGCLALGIIVIASILLLKRKTAPAPIKVGILFSATGPLAITEKPLIDASLMAIDEINARGGLLGRSIEPIQKDGKSTDEAYEQAARVLIEHDKVAAIFGVWESPIRKQLTPIMERHNMLLFYPAYDEGLEASENIVHTGAVPNQYVFPAVWWLFNNLGDSFYLIASNDIYGRAVIAITKFYIASLGGTVAGEKYISHPQEIAPAVKDIEKAQAKVIINALDPDVNIFFFKELRKAGITSEKMPTLSLSVGENELHYFDIQSMVGDYAVWTYFQSIYRPENTLFVNAIKKRFGDTAVASAIMEAAYANVYLWANAVEKVGTLETDKVRSQLKHQIFDAPGGIIYLDDSLHTWRTIYIGRVLFDGQFDIIWNSLKQMQPLIFPPFNDKKYWDTFMQKLYQQFGGKWSGKI